MPRLSSRPMQTMRQVFARRLARIAFGLVLIAGVAVLTHGAWGHHHQFGHGWPSAAQIVGMTWLAAALVAAVVRAIAARLPWSLAPETLFAESMMVPTAGIALLLPITLHLPIALMITDAHGFEFWVEASLWITGLAHIVFAVLAVRRARQLVAGVPAVTPWQIYVATLLTSCVPFVVLWAVPPMLVAITAAPFLPLLGGMQRLVERERAELEALTRALPRAIAVASRRSA